MMKSPLFSLAFIAMSTAPLHAEWDTTKWAINEYKSSYDCVPCIGENKEYNEAYKEALKIMEAWVTPELGAISEWMSSMSFKQAKLPDRAKFGPYYVLSTRGRSEATLKALGESRASYKSTDGIRLNYDDFITPLLMKSAVKTARERVDESIIKDDDADANTSFLNLDYDRSTKIQNSTTLAHEVYHGVQVALLPGEEKNAQTWFSESIPEAVGRAWAYHKYDYTSFSAPNYTDPLHEPTDSDGENIYRRDHFFYYLGEMLGAKPYVAYLKDLNVKSGYDGHNGLKWLDSFLRTKKKPLAEIYPDFIAQYAQNADYFSESDRNNTKNKTYSPMTEVAAGESVLNEIDPLPRQINPVAAIYTEAAGVFTGDWSSLEDQDRIYVNILSIDSADRKDETRLIVGSEVMSADERHIAPVFAAPGKPKQPMHTRVTNVAEKPYESQRQGVRLRLTTGRVDIGLPACMNEAQVLDLNIDSPLTEEETAALFAFGPSELKVSAGSLSADLSTYTAPESAQTVDFSISLPTIDGQTKTVDFRPIEVSDKGCMIQMTAGGNIMTYNAEPEYTEWTVAGRDMGIYISENDLALYRHGWIPLPPQAKATMIEAMNGNITQSMPDGAGGRLNDDESGYKMPKEASEYFSWSTQKNILTMDGGAVERESTPCPRGGDGCGMITYSVEGHPFVVVFDVAGRPLSVTIDGRNVANFAYGGFDIRRPPGF